MTNKTKDVAKETFESFETRHTGPNQAEEQAMLALLGLKSRRELVERVVPESIRGIKPLKLPDALSEFELLAELRERAAENQIYRSYIGLGYYNTITPPVIQRNILENPGWYTQYTPYQPEISQGRLEALINFQTMVCDLSGMAIANASMLDEATAAAEAMTACFRLTKDDTKKKFFVSRGVFPQTFDVIKTRAAPLGIEVVEGENDATLIDSTFFGLLLQYPEEDGRICSYDSIVKAAVAVGVKVIVAADILSLGLLKPPGEWGADFVVGSTQRFGVPLGFGGPHAAYFATREEFKRELPGRLVGVSKDSAGKTAYRLALQVREQHIKRDKATSNICTAQVLLAIMAGMYAVYHGPQGIKRIAKRVHERTNQLKTGLEALGFAVRHSAFFDTLRVDTEVSAIQQILKRADEQKINLRMFNDASLGVSLDETVSVADVEDLLQVFAQSENPAVPAARAASTAIPAGLLRTSAFLEHPVFKTHHTETEFLRYVNRLASRDLSLATAMIPLGSCTMKLNATTEMAALTWPEFSSLHPFVPLDQAAGYLEIIKELEQMLCEVTGFSAASLQPNAGSQGEYAGLMVIEAYHKSRGDKGRTVCLIPDSAHGTNPASAIMAGMKVVVVGCDKHGNINFDDLKAKAEQYADTLGALMVTYPSTHGVFEDSIQDICKIIHANGGQVYLDGANLNAQVGLTHPAILGADVCHINLHKTFCIPHGGGGPGVGPIAVAKHLAPFLPGHFQGSVGGAKAVGPVAAAPWGSALILIISWAYMRMMGTEGLTRATEVAILNANYVAKRLEKHFPVLYKGISGFVAHECILDLRRFKREIGVTVEDVAKRLMDYGFHAPTVSWPVAETMMVEPTESEGLAELDRFCDAMIQIRKEIGEVEKGLLKAEDSPLRGAPHTAEVVIANEWKKSYSREQAAYPVPGLRNFKFWPAVGRVDAAYGDRNLFCSCVPLNDKP